MAMVMTNTRFPYMGTMEGFEFDAQPSSGPAM